MLRRIIQVLVGIVFMLGLLFKFMHYPGAGALLISSMLGMALLLVDRIMQLRSPKLWSSHNISCLLGIIYLFAIAFKVMHLPGASLMLIISMLGFTAILIEFAYSMRQSNYAILPFLFSITLVFALFKIMHWPQPLYVLYGSYFSFAIILPALLFSRGQKLKRIHGALSKHFLILGLLALGLLALEVKLRFYPELWGTEVYQLRIVQALLFVGIVLFVQKILQFGPFKSSFENDYKLLKCLQGIYLIMLVMMVLVAR